ncbi:MAG: hypothetical protein ABL963_17350, partial [Longimicrobiales bacterium]
MDSGSQTPPGDPERAATYRLYGVDVEIDAPEPVRGLIEARLPPMPPGLPAAERSSASPPPRRYRIRRGGGGSTEPERYSLDLDDAPAGHGFDLEGITHRVESDVKLWVTSNTTQVVFVHAGVVAWSGRGLILPGRSHAGKTTLVSALIARGALYYSDDYAVLDHSGRVWPFPQSLAVRSGGDARVFTPPEQLGGRTGRGGIDVGWVIETRYEADSTFDPISMSPGETA